MGFLSDLVKSLSKPVPSKFDDSGKSTKRGSQPKAPSVTIRKKQGQSQGQYSYPQLYTRDLPTATPTTSYKPVQRGTKYSSYNNPVTQAKVRAYQDISGFQGNYTYTRSEKARMQKLYGNVNSDMARRDDLVTTEIHLNKLEQKMKDEQKLNGDSAEYKRMLKEYNNLTESKLYGTYGDLLKTDTNNHQDYIIRRGEEWLNWLQDPHALASFVGDDPSKIDAINDYIANCEEDAEVYDFSKNELVKVRRIKPDAPLPPWVENTAKNQENWAFYTNYIASTQDTLSRSFKEQQAKELDGTTEEVFQIAGASEDPKVIDSYGDIISQFFRDVDKDGLQFKDFRNLGSNVAEYKKEYLIKPLTHGKFFNVGWNALYNAIEVSDYVSKGVRAFASSETAIGGLDDHFEGQRLFWADGDDEESRARQELFMKNGGYELLMLDNPRYAAEHNSVQSEHKRAELEAHLDKIFANKEYDWRKIENGFNEGYFKDDVYRKDSFARGLANVKQAYLEGDSFGWEGNLIAGMIIESVLDPSIVIGGASKSLVRKSVSESAANALDTAARQALKNPASSVEDIFNNKEVNKAIRGFMNQNEGKNIIFKNASKLSNDIDVLWANVAEHLDDVIDADTFKKVLHESIMDDVISANAGIIANTPVGRRYVSARTARTASRLATATDFLDTALLKASYPEPFILAKAYKVLGSTVPETKLAKFILDKRLGKGMLVKDVINGKHISITDPSIAVKEAAKDGADAVDIAGTTKIIRGMNNDAERIVNDLSTGKLSTAEAREQLKITADAFFPSRTSDDLITVIDDWANSLDDYLKGAYIQDIEQFKRAYTRTMDIIDSTNKIAKDNLLDELRLVPVSINYTQDFVEHILVHANTNKVAMSDVLEDAVNIYAKNSGVSVEQATKLLSDALINPKHVTTSVVEQSVKQVSPKGVVKQLNKVKKETVLNIAKKYSFPEHIINDMFKDSESMYYRTFISNIDELYNKEIFNMYYFKHDSSVSELSNVLNNIQAIKKDVTRFIDAYDDFSNAESLTAHRLNKTVQFMSTVEHPSVKKVMNFYNTKLRSIADTIGGQRFDATYQEVTLPLLKIRKQIRSMESFYSFKNALSDDVIGISNDNVNAIIDAMFGVTSKDGSVLKNITSTFGDSQNFIESTLRNAFGESTLSVRKFREALNTPDGIAEMLPSNMRKELDDDPELVQWIDNLVHADEADPASYVDLQILQAICKDNDLSFIRELNQRNETTPVVFVHVSSTGLNPLEGDISGIAYKRWKNLPEENLTLRDVYEAISDISEANSYKRSFSRTELNNIPDSVIDSVYSNSLNKANMSSSVKRKLYSTTFGVSKSNPLNSEEGIIDSFCKDITDMMHQPDMPTAKPVFVTHDLNNYNMKFLNSKVSKYSYTGSSNIFEISEHMNSVNACQIDTYKRFKDVSGDHTLSDDQLAYVDRRIHELDREIGEFSWYDLHGISNNMESLVDSINKLDIDASTPDEFRMLKNELNGAKELTQDIDNMRAQVRQSDFMNAHAKNMYTLHDSSIMGKAYVRPGSDVDLLLNGGVASNSYKKDLLGLSSTFFNDSATRDAFLSNTTVDAVEKLTRFSDDVNNLVGRIAHASLPILSEDLDKFNILIRSVKQSVNPSVVNDAHPLHYVLQLKDSYTDPMQAYAVCRVLYDDFLKQYTHGSIIKAYNRVMKSSNVSELQLRNFLMKYNTRYTAELTGALTKSKFDTAMAAEGLNLVNDDAFMKRISRYDSSIMKKRFAWDYQNVMNKLNEAYKPHIDKSEAISIMADEIRSEIDQHAFTDNILKRTGLRQEDDVVTGLIFNNASVLYDALSKLDGYGRVHFLSFETALKEHFLGAQKTSLINAMKVGDEYNSDKLISEMMWGVGHHKININDYSSEEVSKLLEFVKGLDDSISSEMDTLTGDLYIYLKDGSIDTFEKDGILYKCYKRDGNVVYDNVAKPIREHMVIDDFLETDTFKELPEAAKDQYESVYKKLLAVYDDIYNLSDGAVGNSLGRVLNGQEFSAYYKSIPRGVQQNSIKFDGLMEGLRQDIVYDPGFIYGDRFEPFVDSFKCLQEYSSRKKHFDVLTNNIVGSDAISNLNDIIKDFSDDEVMEFFKNSHEFAVIEFKQTDKFAGFEIKQLDMSKKMNVALARQLPNAAVVPYEFYTQLADAYNAGITHGPIVAFINKMLAADKAVRLIRPMTYINNMKEAYTRAIIDSGEGLAAIPKLYEYQVNAMKDINDFNTLCRIEGDNISLGMWENIQRRHNITMSYDEYRYLSGLSGRYPPSNKAFDELSSGEQILALKRLINKKRINMGTLSIDDFDDMLSGVIPSDYRFENVLAQLRYQYKQVPFSLVNQAKDIALKPMSGFETLIRYSQMKYFNDNGASIATAASKVVASQSDMAMPGTTLYKLEKIFPFITFSYNQVLYYFKLMEREPAYFRYFAHTYGKVSEDHVEDLVSNDELDQASYDSILRGNIPIGDKGYYLKTSNGYIEAINSFYGMPKAMYNKLQPTLKMLAKYSLYDMGAASNDFFNEFGLGQINIANDLYSAIPVVGDVVSRINKLPDAIGDVNIFKYATSSLINQIVGRDTHGIINGRVYDSTSFEDFQEDLAKQGKWYDANKQKIVSLDEANDIGLNDSRLSFRDRQAYMYLKFGKLWDANLKKFVDADKLSEGGLNQYFDMDNDPDAWDKLCAEYKKRFDLVWDANQRKFVTSSKLSTGGLNDEFDFDNDPTAWDRMCTLYDQQFHMLWDANQNAFVKRDKYISGGMNDASRSDYSAYRMALFGEEKIDGEWTKVQDPAIVVPSNSYSTSQEYDNYFYTLGISRLSDTGLIGAHFTDDGLLVNSKGQYVLLDDESYKHKLFNKVIPMYTKSGNYRNYNNYKRYSYNKLNSSGKSAFRAGYTGHLYQAGREDVGFQFSYNYNYKNPKPVGPVKRMYSTRINYPFGGGYHKYSFYSR